VVLRRSVVPAVRAADGGVEGLVAAQPDTTFVGVHFGGYAEDSDRLAPHRVLFGIDEFPAEREMMRSGRAVRDNPPGEDAPVCSRDGRG
jgi:hypothetical protein